MLFQCDGMLRMRWQSRIIHQKGMRRGFEARRDQEGVAGSLTGAQMQRFEASVSEPAVEGGGNSTDGVLEESEATLDTLRIEGCNAHEDILKDLLINRHTQRRNHTH